MEHVESKPAALEGSLHVSAGANAVGISATSIGENPRTVASLAECNPDRSGSNSLRARETDHALSNAGQRLEDHREGGQGNELEESLRSSCKDQSAMGGTLGSNRRDVEESPHAGRSLGNSLRS